MSILGDALRDTDIKASEVRAVTAEKVQAEIDRTCRLIDSFVHDINSIVDFDDIETVYGPLGMLTYSAKRNLLPAEMQAELDALEELYCKVAAEAYRFRTV